IVGRDDSLPFTYDPTYPTITLLLPAPPDSWSQADFHSIRHQIAGHPGCSAGKSWVYADLQADSIPDIENGRAIAFSGQRPIDALI
ncbi:MAG: hypothetical protein OXC95_06025, partial [Dehalococcoidia bacterium]|nr:hypothetical protein [Dehalococcoidia bacterium]